MCPVLKGAVTKSRIMAKGIICTLPFTCLRKYHDFNPLMMENKGTKRKNWAQKSPYFQPNMLELRAFVEQKRIYGNNALLASGGEREI